MKISIITVVKNADKTIEDTILSVLNQTYKNIEFILIDGLSTDGTIEIINKYRDKIDYFISEPDTGIYNAMNKGIKASTGEIIYFLNANDSLYDECVLEKVVKFFKNDNDLDFLYGNVQFTDKEKKDITVYKQNDFKSILTFLDRNICHQTIFYHSMVFKKYGLYDENFKIFSDYEYNVKLLVENRLKSKYIDIFISRFELGGFSSNNSIVKNEEMEKIYNKYFKNNKFHKIDRFFMKFLGSPYKVLKNLKQVKYLESFIFSALNISLRT